MVAGELLVKNSGTAAVAMLSARALRPKFVRMSSTLVGRSGRVYVRDKMLQAHPKKSELNIYLAQ